MSIYNRVLVAVELNSAHEKVKHDLALVEKALKLVNHRKEAVFLIHVVEDLKFYGAIDGVPTGIELSKLLAQDAKKRLSRLEEKIDIPEQQLLILDGSPKHVILKQAQEIKADLIVLGHHAEVGLRKWLGSTANAILHEAPCDVIAVQFNK